MKTRETCLSILVAGAALAGTPALAGTYAPPTERQAYLVNLVREDCGSCHGLTLKGGLGPALLPETLREKNAEALTQTVLFGRLGTPMPPWNPFLSEAEAAWIVDKLQQGFPDAH
jgi:cytochrome c55X